MATMAAESTHESIVGAAIAVAVAGAAAVVGSAAAAGLAQSALQQRTKEAYAAKKDAEFEKANAQAGELLLTEMLALRQRKRDAKAAHAAREAARKQEAAARNQGGSL